MQSFEQILVGLTVAAMAAISLLCAAQLHLKRQPKRAPAARKA